MKHSLAERLNDLPSRLTRDDIRSGKGLGNELSFFVFDFDPQHELEVRRQIPNIISKIQQAEPALRIASINMAEQVFGVLEDLDLLDRAIELESELGPGEATEAIRNAATAQDIAERIVRVHPPDITDLYLLHGVGSAFPIVRAHGLLSNLHSGLRGRPLVLFFPGRFTGRRLVLFDKLQDDHYYRAFRLYEDPC
jgi:hypothetical protein